MRWVIAVVIVAAILVGWVVFSELDHSPVLKCPAGTVRLHGKCIQT